MLNSPTPYPFVGSYALFIDPDLPTNQQAPELVRVQWRREGEWVVSFPLRDGADGTKRVDPAQLIDATELSGKERRDFHDLDRDLAGIEARIRRWAEGDEPGRKPRLTEKHRAMQVRRDALRKRMVYGPIIDRLLRFASAREARKAA